MDANKQIQRFEEFLDNSCKAELLEKIRKGEDFLIVNFAELSRFDPDLADALLDNPEDSIKAAEIAVESFDLPKDMKHFKVRFKNLPQSQKIMVRNIRSKHITKLLVVDGIVRQKSDVRPQVTNAKFECPQCGNVISQLQLDAQFKEPSRCGCGRKGKFRLLSKELVDAQGIVLEEAPEDLEGGEQPKRIQLFLKNDLVSPITERRTNPGSKIRITGILKEVPITLRTGAKSTRFELLIECNFVESIQQDFYDINISREEEEKIRELAADPKVYQKIIDSIAPSIYGYEKIKAALLLQLLGGIQKKRDDGVVTRGDMHILLIGDPGAGKSQLLKRINVIAPKGRYVSGKGVSGAGLTASVVKDEFLHGWSLEAGALVLANKGICCIDEMDKMSPEDRSAMHEALEQQSISISKANIQATLVARTTVLAAANPKFGRFDPYDILANQIDLPPALINRFDLIFPIKDMPDAARDETLAGHILKLHQSPHVEKQQELDTRFLRNFIAYAKQHSKPVLTEGALNELKDYYVEMRNKGSIDEGGVKAIPISPRQLEALVRMSEASAKVRLSQKVTKKDAKRAIELLHYCLSQVGIDPETGKIDIDRITTGVTASQRSHIVLIKEMIAEVENKVGKAIPIDDVVKVAEEKGIDASEVEEVIQKLKRVGDLFEPKRGFIQRI
ncbi:AAA domain-containing protein [Candidatus Woesearchaeota archaeon]|nr:AAA domain-containing protein [Candidatus Woesearchaeota archaeon]